MSYKYKTMIYPFDIETISLIRHKDIIKNFDFVCAVSPNGWSFTGKDASYIDDGQQLNMIIENDFDHALQNCDTVYFADSEIKLDFEEFFRSKILKAVNESKNIICDIELNKELLDFVSQTCKENKKEFIYLKDSHMKIELPIVEKIIQIDTPIVYVTGLSERTNKFEVQVNLRKELISMGYNVSQIGSKNYCELMGFHSFPKFMYSKGISESEKITMFNHYIKKIEKAEEPDVIIIGIPGATMPFDNRFTNKYGMLAYEISMAVKPDFVVFSLLYKQSYSQEYIDKIYDFHKNRFGYEIDCYNVANVLWDKVYSERIREPQFKTIDYQIVDTKMGNYHSSNCPLYNIMSNDDAMKMSEFLVKSLS